MAFVKLNTGILSSTVWTERDVRDVFITALLMARPRYLSEPTPTIKVDSLDNDDFVIPPGHYGFIEAAGPGIVRMALVDYAHGMKALKTLASPDENSRSQEYGGRRLVRVDGGYVVLNFAKYRDRDDTNAERQQRWRDRQKASATKPKKPVTRYITQAEAEAEAEKKEKGGKPPKRKRAASGTPPESAPQPQPRPRRPHRAKHYTQPKALRLIRQIEALAERNTGQAGGRIIRRDKLEQLDLPPEQLAALDAIGGTARILALADKPNERSHVARELAGLVNEAYDDQQAGSTSTSPAEASQAEEWLWPRISADPAS